MSNPWDELKKGIEEALKAEVPALFRTGGDAAAWAAELAEELAREWWRAGNAPTEAERKVALDNVRALKTAAVVRAARYELQFRRHGSRILETAMRLVVGVVVQAVLARVGIPGGAPGEEGGSTP